MKNLSIRDEFMENLSGNCCRSCFVIGRHELKPGEKIAVQSSISGEQVTMTVTGSSIRNMPVFSEDEADAICGQDPLYLMFDICRTHTIKELDQGVTFIAHTQPQLTKLPAPNRVA